MTSSALDFGFRGEAIAKADASGVPKEPRLLTNLSHFPRHLLQQIDTVGVKMERPRKGLARQDA